MSQRAMVFALIAASHLAWLPAALALVPLGPDFQVNTYTTAAQALPAVAADDDGNFVVIWQSTRGDGTDNDSSGSIQGQRFDNMGIVEGPQFQVNTFTAGQQSLPAVAAQGAILPPNAGGFVVVWASSAVAGPGPDTSVLSIQGQRYDSSGVPQGAQFQVNTYTTNRQSYPHVAADAAGNFVVVWQSDGGLGSDTAGDSIQGQRYDAAGVPQGAQFQVNTYTTNDQLVPHVAADAAGNFVVVWQSGESPGSDPSISIVARRFDASGTPQGTDFQVNTFTSANESYPAVALDAAGNFVVVWESSSSGGSDTEGESIQARRYDAGGTPQGDQFQVNTFAQHDQRSPQVAAGGAGHFVVVWHSLYAGSDTSGYSIQGQRYDAAGAPFGGEFQVNSYTTGSQLLASVAADAGTGVVVAWQSQGSSGSDTSLESIQARRFFLPSTTTTSTSSTTVPTFLLPGRSTTIRPGTLAKFVAKPASGETFVLPTAAAVAAGGSLRLFDTAVTAGDQTYTLPADRWISLGPGGSNGYKYRGAGSVGDPCKVVLVRERVVKGVCRGAGVMLTPPFTGDVGVVLSIGGGIYTYCARFGGSEGRNDATVTTRRNAPAPGACP